MNTYAPSSTIFFVSNNIMTNQVSRLVRENLTERATRFNLVLDDVSITHVAFSTEFTHAVEAKQVAQQTALRAAYLVDQAIQEKQACFFCIPPRRFITRTDHIYASLSSYGPREKLVALSLLVKPFARTRVSSSCVAWRLLVISLPSYQGRITRSCSIPRACC